MFFSKFIKIIIKNYKTHRIIYIIGDQAGSDTIEFLDLESDKISFKWKLCDFFFGKFSTYTSMGVIKIKQNDYLFCGGGWGGSKRILRANIKKKSPKEIGNLRNDNYFLESNFIYFNNFAFSFGKSLNQIYCVNTRNLDFSVFFKII